MRNYYKKSKTIPFKQINLFGNIENDSGGSNLNYNGNNNNNSNLSNTSPHYVQQLRQQQNLQYNKYHQTTPNHVYYNNPTMQYQQLAKGLRINSANSSVDNNSTGARDSPYRPAQNLTSSYSNFTNRVPLGKI